MADVKAHPRSSSSDWAIDPLSSWPTDRPLWMLHSADDVWMRGCSSVYGATEAILTWDADAGPRWSGRSSPFACQIADCVDPLQAVDLLSAMCRPPERGSDDHLSTDGRPRDSGGWFVVLAYELGKLIEPTAGAASRHHDRQLQWPLLVMARCELPQIRAIGRGSHAVSIPESPACSEQLTIDANVRATFGTLRPTWTRALHEQAVARAQSLIAAGDIFQANITQRLSASFAGSTRALAGSAMAIAQPRFGAYMELPGGRTIISMSPELFLRVDGATGRVTTRPIKGTLPTADSSIEAARRALSASTKDAAELNMIIDLMRNDLGRVSQIGSVKVPHGRVIESHPTVVHGVGEVRGTLRTDVTPGDLLRATFPAGSITGAPKVRAMQVIDSIETSSRGPYCGAIGFISDHGDITLNVAIRTIAVSGERNGERWDLLDGVAHYGVGGGIVSDSQPPLEHAEAMAKAEVFRQVIEHCNVNAGLPREVEATARLSRPIDEAATAAARQYNDKSDQPRTACVPG